MHVTSGIIPCIVLYMYKYKYDVSIDILQVHTYVQYIEINLSRFENTILEMLDIETRPFDYSD